MIEQILPPGIYCSTLTDLSAPFELWPDEKALLAKATEKRRRDFSAGRACARNSLQQMGIQGISLPADEKRMPLWPPGIIGSITHCSDYCAAAVTRQAVYASLGIDAERDRSIDDRLMNYISLPEERTHLLSLPKNLNWRLLLFSAKESIYKLYYPLRLRRLRFHDVAISFDPTGPCFQASVASESENRPLQSQQFQGNFLVAGDLYLTAAWQSAE
jgi:4'-phosphopantetheinyl transferase EntD